MHTNHTEIGHSKITQQSQPNQKQCSLHLANSENIQITCPCNSATGCKHGHRLPRAYCKSCGFIQVERKTDSMQPTPQTKSRHAWITINEVAKSRQHRNLLYYVVDIMKEASKHRGINRQDKYIHLRLHE